MLLFVVSGVFAADEYTNSVGAKMIQIKPGTFEMGSDLPGDSWDRRPVHKVTISKPFYMSETEVTIEQFKQFRPDFQPTEGFEPYAAGVSWYDAVAFCKWLSEKEGKTYRLPTEAEWEYACRAGTTTLFSSGNSRPEPETANGWGLKNMHTGVREWCLDWHGTYPIADQVDPVGPEYGLMKIVRGGGLDNDEDYFARSAARLSIAPSFGPYPEGKTKVKSVAKDVDLTKLKPGLIGTKYGDSNLKRAQNRISLTSLDQDYSREDNTWSGRWYGYIEAPFTGEVTFEGQADDGMRLKIGDKMVIDAWDKSGTHTGKMAIVKGRKYPVVLSYSQDGGAAYMRLYWSWAGHEKEIVPGSVLWHSSADEKKSGTGASKSSRPGAHNIGFRVVQAPMPTTKPLPYEGSYVQQGVIQNKEIAKFAPDATKPYYMKRYLLPTPPENRPREEIDAAGLHPSFRRHNHSPGFTICPNGDALLIIYTSYSEYEPGVSLMASRLRFGTNEWDMPDSMFDSVGVNDHAPLLWTDGDVVDFFWGNPHLFGGFPFQWTSSRDNGAAWSPIRFPDFKGKIGPHSRQPINTVLRDKNGTIYIASDAKGGSSVLWASKDNGITWYDTGGRSAGRHTTYVLLKDGSILGMGGKNTDIDGFMPKAISKDGGRTWQVSKTPFAALGSNQRPCIQRLQDGKLLFIGDFQRIDGAQPEGITQRGSYAALSDNDGLTWTVKKLVGTQQHENPRRLGGSDTLGYSVARQAPNGLIHIITTMNRPCLHFVFNEAWILTKDTKYDHMSDEELMQVQASRIGKVQSYTEKYPNGKVKVEFSGGIADNGRFLLDGAERWYYPDGSKQREATYKLGRKIGTETYWARDGHKKWQWEHKADGTSVWTQWWSNGQKKAQSTWRNFKCDGVAICWDPAGKVISRKKFSNGKFAD